VVCRTVNKLTQKKICIYFISLWGNGMTKNRLDVPNHNLKLETLNAKYYKVEIQTIYASVFLSVLYFLFRFLYSGITQTPLPPHSLRFHLWE